MKPTIAVLCLVLLAACGGAAPRDRYVEAVKARASGDNRAYYDAMVELAHEAPDTRVGRKARANLNTGMFGSLYWLAILGGGLAGYLDSDGVGETLIKGDSEAAPEHEVDEVAGRSPTVSQAALQAP